MRSSRSSTRLLTAASPIIAPGIRQIVGYDQFDVNDVKKNGFPPDAGVGWFPLWLTVKLNRYPRNIYHGQVRQERGL